MPSSWNPPTEASVGEPIDLGVEFCSPANTATEHGVFLDETPIISELVSDVAGPLCVERGVGELFPLSDQDAFESDPLVEASNGNLVITQAGTYTLTFEDPQLSDSQTITVTESFNPDGVYMTDCVGLPNESPPGKQHTITPTLKNDNDSQATAVVVLKENETKIAETQTDVRSQTPVSFTFDAPTAEGDYTYTTEVQSASKA